MSDRLMLAGGLLVSSGQHLAALATALQGE